MQKYMAIAFGRDNLRRRVYGAVISYEEDEIAEMREFETRAGRRKIDITYKGPNKEDAKSSIRHLRSFSGSEVLNTLFAQAFPELCD